MMVCVVAIFISMLIRPQSQKLRQKQLQSLISSLKTGDKVITTGGMHGLITNVKDATVLVKFADNVKIEVDRSAITTVTKRTDDESDSGRLIFYLPLYHNPRF